MEKYGAPFDSGVPSSLRLGACKERRKDRREGCYDYIAGLGLSFSRNAARPQQRRGRSIARVPMLIAWEEEGKEQRRGNGSSGSGVFSPRR